MEGWGGGREQEEPISGKFLAAIAAALAGYLEAEALGGSSFRIVGIRRAEHLLGALPLSPWALVARWEAVAPNVLRTRRSWTE